MTGEIWLIFYNVTAFDYLTGTVISVEIFSLSNILLFFKNNKNLFF